MVELKLDAGALDKLFPEGSDARVSLQSCVMDAMVKRLAQGKFAKKADDIFGREVDAIVKDSMTSWQAKLNKPILAMIDNAAKLAVNEQVKAFNRELNIAESIRLNVEHYANSFANKKLDGDIQKYIDLKMSKLRVGF